LQVLQSITCDDIKLAKPTRYRVSLLKTFKAGFYPGVHLLPNVTIHRSGGKADSFPLTP